MATPLRLNPDLVTAAQRAGLVQKRSVPKQIEFWATLGKAVESVLDYADIFAILQGLKKITIEPVTPDAVSPDDVFAFLEQRRSAGELKTGVTQAALYYEASCTCPGLLDQVNTVNGERVTGQFRNGQFIPVKVHPAGF